MMKKSRKHVPKKSLFFYTLYVMSWWIHYLPGYLYE